jgi:hypothetical protein
VAQALASFGALDVLINNDAGIMRDKTLLQARTPKIGTPSSRCNLSEEFILHASGGGADEGPRHAGQHRQHHQRRACWETFGQTNYSAGQGRHTTG